jgi:hypothetical protein
MKENSSAAEDPTQRFRWRWFIVAGCLLVILIAVLLPRQREPRNEHVVSTNTLGESSVASASAAARARRFARASGSAAAPAATAEEIVTGKLNQFARHRRELVHALARHYKVEVPAEVEQFFDAVEARRWDVMQALYEGLRERRMSESGSEGLGKLWPAIVETLGVAEAVKKWPSQKLLDYGNSILDSLRPGMVYVGGNDAGRFIPTLLNETSEGEHHIIVTQNAFADASYLEYADFLYKDRLGTLTREDSQRVFQDYISDAQKRFRHDQEFPNEPKQLRPGEDVQMIDGRTQVSGHIAVMAINEKLLRALMEKNPDASFAIAQSFPFTSMYGDARPLGPIMELRVQDEQNALTRERAAQSVDYWRTTAQQVFSDPGAVVGEGLRMTYSKMVAEQAALLLHHGYTAEAEQAFGIATEIGPASPEAVFRYVSLLVEQKRFDEAIHVTETAVNADAGNQHQFRNLADELNRMKTRK